MPIALTVDSDVSRSDGFCGSFCRLVRNGGDITPENEGTCHYFWNFVRTFHTEDEALTRSIQLAHVNESGKGLYDQDVTVLQAQQKAIERHPRMPFYNLNIDAGALWAHRLINRMVEAEAVQRAPVPSAAE